MFNFLSLTNHYPPTLPVAPEKMPTCKFFLEGVCTADNCPYLHVKVNSEAAICQQFLKGYCPNGTDCKKRHVIACPNFDKTVSVGKERSARFHTSGKMSSPRKKLRPNLKENLWVKRLTTLCRRRVVSPPDTRMTTPVKT